MRLHRAALALGAWLGLAAAYAAGGADLSGSLPAGYREELRVEIVNAAGAPVRASRDGGTSWREIGHVVQAAGQVNVQGYRAAAWVPDSTVAATAVNGVHLKIAGDPRTGRGIIISLIPQGELLGAAEGSASIMLDNPPGEGVFGGYGPTVGSPVLLGQGEEWRPLPAGWKPASGDRLLVLRMVPARAVRYLDLANVFGGRITVTYVDGGEEWVGTVLRPVTGIGRFEGGRYAAAGRIRANHAGVVDISTSPYGSVGGFQILPWDHANDSEMDYVRTNGQWLVVGPVDMREGQWRAQPPLFWGLLYPSYRAADLEGADWVNGLLSRAQVLCKRGEGEWEPLPWIGFSHEAPADSPPPEHGGTWWLHEPASPAVPLPPLAQHVLTGIRALRIVLPVEPYWPG